MQAIGGAVGEGAANAVGDVALVQAILVVIQRAAQPPQPASPGHPAVPARAAGPYLPSYSGTFGPGTAAAIRAFQTDHVFRSPTGETAPNPRATDGAVSPGDATWAQLVAQAPAAFKDLRVLAGRRTVYLEATAAELQAKLTAAAGKTFTDAFRVKVNATIRRMHADHGIAIGVDPRGDRRSFQTQYDIRHDTPQNTNAGPGESNHNFGGAADLGFEGWRWLKPDGTVVTDDPWLAKLTRVSAAEATAFWDALRTAGTALGAFRGPAGDRPHLQNWNDATVSMRARLAVHLARSGSMHWAAEHRGYSSDLGFGGAKVVVGTAMQIWNYEATIDAATIARLRAAAPRRQGQPDPPQPPHPGAPPARPGAPPARPGGPPGMPGLPVDPRRTAAAEVDAMRHALRHEFDLADSNWRAWTDQ
ncbi:hypothetical protein [Sphingomonas sp.]|uniref:peptidoglycan-binding domain-containing protein n=1 Tax=Sphingomonas sp. TaxID=28214 RepID=UPI003CC66F7B